MKFNTAIKSQSLVYAINRIAKTNDNTYPLEEKALNLNFGLDIAYGIIMNSVDTKGYDDKNYTKLPQGTYDITAGERNVTIDDDEEGGEILKIYKVFAKNSNGEPYELIRSDIRNKNAQNIAYGTETGQVSMYDWVGNSMVFDVTPETTIAGGIKVFYMRNSTYFVGTDTEKEVGLPATLVSGLVDYASLRHTVSRGLQKKEDLKQFVAEWKKDIEEFASSQSIEENKRLTPFRVNAE